MNQFDLIIIGGGPAGYLAAERAGAAGLATLLIEKNAIGGVCLNEGCIPTKTLLNSAKLYEHACHSVNFGVTAENVTFDQARVVERKNKIVKNLVSSVSKTLKSANVIIKQGFAMIQERSETGVLVSVDEDIFEGKRLLIASGSETVVPDIPGIRAGMANGSIMTNREILDLQTVPESVVVVGGGIIGLEMASYFNSVGSKVTVIEMLGQIAGQADRELADIMLKVLEKSGITFHLGSQVTAFGQREVTFEKNALVQQVPAEVTLISVGRRPVTKGYGLERIGVQVDRGRIVTDDRGKTNVPNVFAAGDVNGMWMLAHAAYREAEVVINNILGQEDRMDYTSIPSVIYTNPEMAFVGETDQSCLDKGIVCESIALPMNYSGRYMAENDNGKGLCKLVFEKQSRRLLGCHLLGSYASEIIVSAGIMIENRMTIERIREMIFPHPTVSEIIREAVFKIR